MRPRVLGTGVALLAIALALLWLWRARDAAPPTPDPIRSSTVTSSSSTHSRATPSVARDAGPNDDGFDDDPFAAVELTGFVLSASTSLGIEGARVRVHRGATPIAETRSTRGGAFSFMGIGPGRYRFEAEAEGFVPAEFRVAKLDVLEDDSNITLRLAPAGRLRGTVRDPTGRPLEGSRVVVVRYSEPVNGDPWAETETDADGRYGFELVPLARIGVIAHHLDFGFVEESLDERSEVDSTVDLRFEVARTIRGEVRGPGGPIAGARVWLSPPGPSRRGSVRDVPASAVHSRPDGRYELRAPEDAFAIVAWAEGHRSEGLRVLATTDRIDFELEPSLSLEVRVEDAQGRGVPEVWMSVADGEGGYSRATSDANGEAELTDLRPGAASLRLKTSDGQERLETITLEAGPVRTITIALEGRGGIRGHLVSATTGDRITEMFLILGRDGHAFTQRLQSPSGSFSFEGVAPGRWTLFVQSPGFLRRSLEGLEIGTSMTALGPIELEPLARVEGRVSPAPGTTLLVGEAKPQPIGNGVPFPVEADGRFVAELRAGSYEVEFRDGEDRLRANTHWHLRAGEFVRGVEIDLREF